MIRVFSSFCLCLEFAVISTEKRFSPEPSSKKEGAHTESINGNSRREFRERVLQLQFFLGADYVMDDV